tara:strand:- start:97 stop:375 length:279 start_codon:yes stop_codon:yes gene_type:complete
MNIFKVIKNVKKERNIYIESFDPINLTEEEIFNTSKNINLQSIRVHKYLTHTGIFGKVITAKFLYSINLNENTKFFELDNQQIKLIIKYCKA